MTIGVLHQKGQSNTPIAKVLGVTEGTVRYHLRREHVGDGRKKPLLIEQQGLAAICQAWWEQQLESLPESRSPNAELLWQMLVDEHQYSGSAKSVRKYVRMPCSRPRLRPFRRIETPPGALAQSDWLEVLVDIGTGLETVYRFVMVLAHSRKTVLVWSHAMDQWNWHRVHNEAFSRLGGIPAVNRIDNLKTGVAHGAGPWGQINATDQAYAHLMGFHVDPHEPYAPHQKGKVERQVGWIKQLGFVGCRLWTSPTSKPLPIRRFMNKRADGCARPPATRLPPPGNRSRRCFVRCPSCCLNRLTSFESVRSIKIAPFALRGARIRCRFAISSNGWKCAGVQTSCK